MIKDNRKSKPNNSKDDRIHEYISKDAKEGINTLIQLIRNIDVKIYTRKNSIQSLYLRR